MCGVYTGFLEMVELEFNLKYIYQMLSGVEGGAMLYSKNFPYALVEV